MRQVIEWLVGLGQLEREQVVEWGGFDHFAQARDLRTVVINDFGHCIRSVGKGLGCCGGFG